MIVCFSSVSTRAHTKGCLPLYRLVAQLPDDEAPLSACRHLRPHLRTPSPNAHTRTAANAWPGSSTLRPAEHDDRRSIRLLGRQGPAAGTRPGSAGVEVRLRWCKAPAPRAAKRDHDARTGLALGCAVPRLSRLDCSQLLILLIATSLTAVRLRPDRWFPSRRSSPPGCLYDSPSNLNSCPFISLIPSHLFPACRGLMAVGKGNVPSMHKGILTN